PAQNGRRHAPPTPPARNGSPVSGAPGGRRAPPRPARPSGVSALARFTLQSGLVSARMSTGLRRLDPSDLRQVDAVSRLHATLLPASPVAALGPAFPRRFYYRTFVEDGLVVCDLFYDRETPAGFVAYTKFGSGFVLRGMRRHWFSLSVHLMRSVLFHPSRLGTIIKLLGPVWRRSSRAT